MSENKALAVYSAPLPDRMEYARVLAQSNLLPAAYAGRPQNVLIAMEYGASLNLPPMQALQGINVINGKPTASADLMAALVRRAGHKLRIEGDDARCTATIVRADDPDHPMSVTWTMDKAQRAGLVKRNPTWQAYPGAMLRARAISDVARMAANDALHGVIYTPEELTDTVAPSGEPVVVEAVVESGAGDGGVVDAELEPEVPGSVESPGEVYASEETVQRLGGLVQALGLTRAQTARTFEYVLGGDYDANRLTENQGARVVEYLEMRLNERNGK